VSEVHWEPRPTRNALAGRGSCRAPTIFPTIALKEVWASSEASPSRSWTARPCGAGASLEFDVWLALILTFSPWENERQACAAGFPDVCPANPVAQISKGRRIILPLLVGEGWGEVEPFQLTFFSAGAFIERVQSGNGCGARACNSLKMVSRMLCASRRKWEFQNLSVLMPRESKNASRPAS
jgi:hypothetical protein